MFLYRILVLFLIIALSYAKNSEFEFEHHDEILIGKQQLQVYYNNLSQIGSMDIKLILESGKEYQLSNMICRVDKGQFNWTPPDSIPNGSVGKFEYVIYVGDISFDGTSEDMKFVNEYSTKASEEPTPTNAASQVTDQAAGNSTQPTIPSNIIPSNTVKINTTNNENVTESKAKEAVDNQKETNEEKKSFEITDYVYYIGGGGIFVVALTGFFIFYKVRSKKNPKDYDFDSRPYNNTSMDVSQIFGNKPLINASGLAPMSMMGSSNFNNSSNNNSMNMNNSSHMMYNNMSSYHVPNIESINNSPAMMASPAMNYNFSNNNSVNNNNNSIYNGSNHSRNNSTASSGFYNNASNTNTMNMNMNMATMNNTPRHDNYEMMDFNTVDRNTENIINVNGNNSQGSSNGGLTIDVQMAQNTGRNLPNSENYSATPRHGSLPRNKVPIGEVEPLNDEKDSKSYNNYRSSILSYISSNRGSFYGTAQAEHSINHELLNQICTVAYASQPENEDELYLCVGDKVKILEVYDDGWAYSLHISSGLEGMLPLNCTAEYYN